jgi:hypothetical protein
MQFPVVRESGGASTQDSTFVLKLPSPFADERTSDDFYVFVVAVSGSFALLIADVTLVAHRHFKYRSVVTRQSPISLCDVGLLPA